MKYLIPAIISLIALSVFYACKNKKTIDPHKIYSDKEMLGRILDFSKFPPNKVLFKYQPILNSIEGKQPSFLPAPKDYALEAVLHFLPEQIKEIKLMAKEIPNENQDFVMSYLFKWIPEENRLKPSEFQSAEEYEGKIFFPAGTAKMMIYKNTVYLFALTH